MRKKILIITTGGTIAMKYTEGVGVVPDNDLVRMIQSFPQINNIAEISILEFSNIPSPHMTPEKMLELAILVDDKAEIYDGIAITHGTDTLEESAYFLNLVLRTRKPVVFTAAMRSGNDLGLDGPRNIVGAVKVASSDESIDKGVLVVMNDEINAARDVTKFDTGKINTFTSPGYGILGIVDSDRVVYYRRVSIKDSIWTDRIETNIDMITAVSGMDGRHIEASIQNKAKAIVIEAFGRGNLPPAVIPSIKKALSENILVMIVSRTITGRVLPEYGYEAGGAHLEKLGCILGYDLKGIKARIILMLLFGKYGDKNKVKEAFDKMKAFY